jgi:hypothetical protein
VKRQLSEWEKILTNYTYNKGLVTRIYRELKGWTLKESTTHQINVQMNKQTILKRRNTNSQQMYEEMPNIFGDENDTEIPLHCSQNGYHQ